MSTNINNKLNKDLPILLVDTSYWLYYRFFALRNWYSRAYPENVRNNPNFNIEHNWLEDEVFIIKYKKLFIENIKKLCKKFNTKLTNVVFCIDCPHNDIWRCSKTDNYKGGRLESHKKKQFNSFNLFSHIKRVFLPILQTNYNIKIISCANCEADDVIGYASVSLINRGFKQIYILATDNDYLQICNDKIHMINGNGNIISIRNYNNSNGGIDNIEDIAGIDDGISGIGGICGSGSSSGNGSGSSNSIIVLGEIVLGEKYLISKILLGDTSDNIKCCSVDSGFISSNICNINNICNGNLKNVTKTLALQLINNKSIYTILQNMLYSIRKVYVDIGSVDDIDSIENIDIISSNIKHSSETIKFKESLENIKFITTDKFIENTILMDFQMIPTKLKDNIESKLLEVL